MHYPDYLYYSAIVSRVNSQNISQPSRPPAALAIALILLAESVLLAVLAALSVIDLFVNEPISLAGSIFLTVLLVAFSAWLAVLGHFLFRGYRWTRNPALVIQLFAIILAFPAFQEGLPLVGFAILIPAVIAVVLLFTRRVVEFLVRTTDSSSGNIH